MSNRYTRRNTIPLAHLPPDDFMRRVNHTLNRLLVIFLGLTVAFAGLTIALAVVAPHDVNELVWGRLIAEMIIAGVYFFYAYLWRKGRFWGYLKLITTSGWAALVIASVIIAPGKYPIWVRIEQVAQFGILICLVWVLGQPAVRKRFAKKATNPTG